MKMQIKRSELYATKGKVTLPLPEEENTPTMYELKENFSKILEIRRLLFLSIIHFMQRIKFDCSVL